MKRQEAEKLLGGYAAGNLTHAERERLFAAALEDQQLFETLIREEPLREVLADPASRTRLLADLADPPCPWYYRPLSPAAMMLAVATLAVFVVNLYWWPLRHREPVNAPKVEPQVVTVRPEPKPFVAPEIAAPQPVKSPIPAQLPAPPELQTPEPAHPVLEALSEPVPSSPARPPAATATAVQAPGRPPGQKFRMALAPVAERLLLQPTLMKKLSDGQLVEADPRQELERDGEFLIRVAANQSGTITLLRKDAQSRWQPVEAQPIRASIPVSIPRGGLRFDSYATQEYQILFSPMASGGPPVSVPITLRYK